MKDRELLEFAAKAAGCEFSWEQDILTGEKTVPTVFDEEGLGSHWNPLTDDGDALRLAVTLGLVVDCSRPSAGEPFKQHHVGQVDFQDQQAATRRAIVRAAAAIGKEMP